VSSDLGSLAIEQQVEKLESIADPATRALAIDLIASVLKLHAAGLERMLAILEEQSSAAEPVLAAFRQDPLVRGLLALHDLSDEAPQLRVEQALRQLEPQLERSGAVATVLQLDEEAAHVVIRMTGHSCGSTAESVRTLVERALVEAAPDLKDVQVRLEERDTPAVLIPASAIEPAKQPTTSAVHSVIK
jgi:Fe-S cluster biogenesis protein NfuA